MTNTGSAFINSSLYHLNTSPMRILAERKTNEFMPKAYTCDGAGVFPELSIHEIPLDAKVVALIVDDPDAPGGTWDHLLVANIPVSAQSLSFGSSELSGGVHGKNSW